jgi:molecular chaperone DnaK
MYLGIDLGTSNSVVAGIDGGEARIFRPADGGEALPSVIYFDKRGHRLYGRRAYDQALVSPENVAAGFKRLMGTSTPIEIKGANLTLTPEECSAEIIRQLLGQVETETGITPDQITGTVITVPAAFNQMQSEATLRAARAAGLTRIDLLQEPIAAAMAAMEGAKRSGQFLVYDLGGGTFDVALVEAINGEVNVVAHQGINMLGGRDFDRVIVNEVVRPWLVANFDLPENFQRDKQYQRLIRIAQLAAEKAKIDLSAKDETSIFASDDEIRLTDQSDTEIFLDAPMDRPTFENLIREPVMQTVELIRNLLSENNYKHEDIDRIVFVGGPSRIPLIRHMVSEELGIAADIKTDPMAAVAVGAAYYCENRTWDNKGVSAPKPKTASATVPAEPRLSFQYTQRTADDKTTVTLYIEGGKAPDNRQLQIKSKDWDSGALPLADGLTISLPLKDMGEHKFTAHVLDEQNKILPQHDQTLTITRLVASAGSIPAVQTMAVKALESAFSKENVLLPLVKKGDILPASGKVRFKSARELRPGQKGHVSFEVFQVEYPERVDLNLCVGVFRIMGDDLPESYAIKDGDPVGFEWRMSDSGILEATVHLDDGLHGPLELKTPRFYAPQAGQISFAGERGMKFAGSLLKQGEEEWGDIAAASGPEGGPEVQLLRTRLTEQKEILDESANDPESVRRVAEETRFIRQDIAKMGRKHRSATIQRKLGKTTAVFNRIARAYADKGESERFDNHIAKLQEIIDAGDVSALDDADQHLNEMRDLFFSIGWRNADYIYSWYKRLASEPYLFPDPIEFSAMVKEGGELVAKSDKPGLKTLVSRMLAARIMLDASDIAGELATIIKG